LLHGLGRAASPVQPPLAPAAGEALRRRARAGDRALLPSRRRRRLGRAIVGRQPRGNPHGRASGLRAEPPRARGRGAYGLRGLLLAGAASAFVLFGSYAIAMRHMDGNEAVRAARIFLGSRQASEATIDRIVAISRLSKQAGHY